MLYSYDGNKISLSLIALFNPASILAFISGYLINKKYQISEYKKIYKKINLYLFKYLGWCLLYYIILLITKNNFTILNFKNISSFANENISFFSLLITPKNHLWYLSNLFWGLLLFFFIRKNIIIIIILLISLPLIYQLSLNLEDFLKFRFIYFFIWGIFLSRKEIYLYQTISIFITSLIVIFIFNKGFLLNITLTATIFFIIVIMLKFLQKRLFILIDRKVIFLIYFFHPFIIKLLIFLVVNIFKINFERIYLLSIFSIFTSFLIINLMIYLINKLKIMLEWDIYL